MSAFTIVADAPSESVITTSLLLKSIAVSRMRLSSSSVDELSEAFKVTSSNPVSSSPIS